MLDSPVQRDETSNSGHKPPTIRKNVEMGEKRMVAAGSELSQGDLQKVVDDRMLTSSQGSFHGGRAVARRSNCYSFAFVYTFTVYCSLITIIFYSFIAYD